MEVKQGKSYSIKINNFEGPFDLLFHLFEKNQVNIYDIPINEITDQYMDYLFAMEEMDLEIASDFLLMASTLLHIKSKMLLPEKKENKEEIDPREELVNRLIEYGKFKEYTRELKDREKHWEKVIYKAPEVYEIKHAELVFELDPIALRDALANLINRNIKKVNKGAQNIITILQHEKVSLRSKIREVMRSLIDFTCVSFSNLFSLDKNSKTEVVTGFMAILELTKIKKVWLEQSQTFSEIIIHRKNYDSFDEEKELSHIKADEN